jgi:hypothetical protein
MVKLDLRKELKQVYQSSANAVAEVEVPPFTFLMVDGQGDPNRVPAYAEAVAALFTVSYTAKFMVKKSAGGQDYAVMPLEGLWWADDLGAFQSGDRDLWRWTMMIMQPAFVPESLLREAMAAAAEKKSLPAIGRLRIETFAEGRCAQLLHVGPFSTEGPTVQRLHDWIDAHGSRRGRHHEIYLTDVRRTDPSRWKTIIRQPMVRQPRVRQPMATHAPG